ncbi:hypothetical protein KKH23_10060 [Patescibacteria group bacterium]|uniref:Putative glycosyltransferase n=1 Tax=viral metagenome TaxID=1070528 RepID=A0A6M3MA19_9ZZZZ|nr:hypothetical protein [Patescibacteria group bacterium]MBU0847516.1 hypothetical protein [Patescibacteria group bacterium]
MKIWNVPIESLEERYSKSWNAWFPSVFDFHEIVFETIYPMPLSDKIRDGAFLDICGTNYFKASQLAILMKKIYDGEIVRGDIIFLQDLWFPGLEMLQYCRQGLPLDFKICGILHAGTYDPFDFLSKCGMGAWGKNLENCWFNFVDKIFVATQFHKMLIHSHREIIPSKIAETGLPIYNEQQPFDMMEKENIVVFPHRLDSEKNPQMFDRLARKAETPGWQFIKTKDVCKTKKEYYDLLNRAKIAISFADQETWGIAQQEAIFAGCFPVVPNKLSYRELYSDRFKYDFFTDAVLLTKHLMSPNKEDYEEFWRNREQLLDKGRQAILNIIHEMEKL